MLLPFDDTGEGPAVVLLHAGIADRRMWGEQLGPLAGAGLRVIAMDMPGFGQAPVAEGKDEPWLDVLETMDAAGVDQAALVGNSLGGAIAQCVAVVSPERVSALALISSPAPGMEASQELSDAWETEEYAVEAGDIDGAIDAVLDSWLLPDAPPAVRELVGEMQRRAFDLQLGAPEPEEVPDPLGGDAHVISGYAGPVLIAVGEHDMSDFHGAAEKLGGALPEARREVIYGAGHLAPLEQPEALTELLVDFLL